MKSKKNLFDRLSLKKKIALNKKNKISDQLVTESLKNAELIKQIKELQDQTTTEDTGTKPAFFLKSKAWYTQKLVQELDQSESKQKFIERELREIQKKIALERRNVDRTRDKANEIRKQEVIKTENKRDTMTIKINKI
ncbi:hypothetical protein OA005_02325 [Paracoccaceae bacterium]|nr:hypothetical protein [Paracoccaceae bacterium]